MKELSIEEKAKRYDEAIEKFGVILNLNTVKESGTIFVGDVRKIFPELKESEDERIRKELICFLETEIPQCAARDKYVAWLEKQGNINPTEDELEALRIAAYEPTKNWSEKLQSLYEKLTHCEQKPTDKVEPKFNFKVSQWIVATGKCVYLITKIDGFNVTLVDTNGDEYVFDTSSLNDAHEWTIQDAKAGDVLATDDWVFIFKELNTHGKPVCYCHYDDELGFKVDVSSYLSTGSEIRPATKEQRDTLMKAMADAGCTFDFEKKELKKIEQKTAWSEEDEKYWSIVIAEFSKCAGKPVSKDEWMRCNDWLNSLRNRVQPQPKQEWSEEDEREVAVLEAYIRSKDWSERHIDRALGIVDELVNKVKSLRPQKQWKPSDEQMEALKDALNDAIWQYDFKGSPIKEEVTRKHAETIESLYNDLKKLREK